MEIKDLKLLQQQVNSLRGEGKYKEAIEESYNLLHHGMEVNDHKSLLVAHLVMAASFYCIGDMEEAFHSIDTYSEVCNEYGDEADWVNLYNVLFLLYEFNKDFEKAKETLRLSIELGEKIQKYNIVSNGYSNFSHIYLEEENYEKALEMAERGLEMAKLHKPESLILEIRVKLNLAKSYIALNDFGSSKILMDEINNAGILDSFIRERSQYSDLLGS